MDARAWGVVHVVVATYEEREWASTGTTETQWRSEEGMHVGWSEKPAKGIWNFSESISPTPVRVKPLTSRSIGCPLSLPARWIWCAMTGAEAKKFASLAASISVCIALVREFIACVSSQPLVCNAVSPPDPTKCTTPGAASAHLPTTKPFHASSVQMVTRQPSCVAIPRASATKGCTSPRVPRDSMKM